MAVDADTGACSTTAALSEPPLPSTKNKKKKLTRKEKQLLLKKANRARQRLLSIRYDVDTFAKPLLAENALLKHLPVIANERCGSWYACGLSTLQKGPLYSCYFKSTDGHVGTYNFSLKRLNLNVIDVVSSNNGCVILDASVYKEMPDSFSRSIPIWCAVLNRICAKYRTQLGLLLTKEWDNALYTPDWIVSKEERDTIEALIDTRVQELYDCHAIVDPKWLATTLVKPLRPYWITPQHDNLEDMRSNEYFAIVCLNASEHYPNRLYKQQQEGFWYTPGAADDQQEWARHLTPRLFWNHVEQLLNGEEMTDNDTDLAIDTLVQQEQLLQSSNGGDALVDESLQNLFDVIGDTKIAIGTRRAGRPPECWQHFDAILNVTDMEYDDIQQEACHSNEKFYLQLPVKEGKRDKTELERWMAVGILYCVMHAQQDRRILVHCAQGKDRSVAIVMAVIVLFCNSSYPVQWKDGFRNVSIVSDFMKVLDEPPDNDVNAMQEERMYKSSGLPKCLVNAFQGKSGRDAILDWVRIQFAGANPSDDDGIDDDTLLATKETLRIALHLLRQDREKAEPTRSTMQKLNRFFMSGSYEMKCGGCDDERKAK